MEKLNLNRKIGLDVLKCIAAFLVVCIHASFYDKFGDYFTAISRIAVPIFFMISGYFYTRTVEKENQNKQILRILKLCIIANVLFFIYKILVAFVMSKDIVLILKDFFSINNIKQLILLNESPFAIHLWYLNALLYVVIIMKFINRYDKYKVLYIITPFLLLTNLLLGKYSLLIIKREYSHMLVRNFLFIGLPYFAIGNYIEKSFKERKININNKLMIFFTVLLIITTVLERYILDKFNLDKFSDMYISTIFLSIIVFLIFLTYENKKDIKIVNYIAKIGREYSLNIYLLHIVVIDIMKKIFGGFLFYNYFAPIVVFVVTILICILYKKITNNFKEIIKRKYIKQEKN